MREGKLELDRPLSDYLETPYVPYLDDPRIVRITARIALSHTTGFQIGAPRSGRMIQSCSRSSSIRGVASDIRVKATAIFSMSSKK